MKTNDSNRVRRLRTFAAIACAAAIVAIVVTVTAFPRGGISPPRAFGPGAQLAWRASDEQSYGFRMQSQISLGISSADGSQDVEQVIDGTLHLRVFELRGDDVKLGFQLSPVALSVNGRVDRSRSRDLATAFGATFSRDGRPGAFRFPSALDLIAQMQLEEIVRSFQVIVPAAAGTEWQTEEQHASGTYAASYDRSADREIAKHKLAYRKGAEMRDGSGLLGTATTRVNSSSLTATLAGSGSWLESASVREELVVFSDGGTFKVVTDAELQLEIVPSDLELALRSVADLPALIANQQDSVTNGRVVSAPVPTAADIAGFRDMVAAFNASGGEDLDLLRALADKLREFPQLAGLVPDMLGDPALVDRAASGLIHVLELCGHGPAQEALGEIAADPQRSLMNRIRAIIASGDVEAPSGATLESLWQLSVDRSSEDASDLANTALLSLGRLAGTLRGMDSGDYDELRSRLSDTLAASHDAGATSAALKAIGNTRDAELSVDVERHLSSHSSLVRAAAAETVAELNGPTALETLTNSLRQESSGRVRAKIVEGLGAIDRKSAATFAAVDAGLQNETDETARYAMAVYLAENLEAWPQGRRTLEKVMKTTTEARTLQYLAGKLSR